MNLTALLLACLVPGGAVPQGGPARASGTAASQPNGRSELPVDLERIQREIAREPAIQVPARGPDEDTGLPTYRVQIDARKLTIEEILGPDYLRGAVPYGGMTHQEFLNMVTPTDVQGYAAFSNGQAATVALTSLALKWALKTALEEFHQAKDARAREAARKEVQEALEALRKARREAGLPDK
jgi:hypothetical protein